MKIILIFALIGAVLYAIDMLICKISLKAGYIVAIFNLPFLPVGIITFILTQKYLEKTLGVSDVTQYFRESGETAKQKKKKGKSSANISKKAAEVQANKRIEVFIPIGTLEIKEKEFENREDIISVVIPKGVNRIRKQAFAGCKNLKKVSLPDDITISPDAFLYCNKLSDEAEQRIADKVEGMYSKSFVNSFRYSTPNSDPNYDTTGEGLDTNKFIYETRRAQNGEFYTACFSRLGNPQGTHTDSRASSTQKTKVTEPQTSAETIANTKKSESVNGKHGRLIFNDPYGKFSHQTSSIKSRAHNANIEIGVQEKDRQPTALTIKVTECACYGKSETVSYFKANYNDLDSRDLPIFVDEMKKLHFLDSYKGKNETYRALIGNDIKTITKEQYESLGFDFKVNEKKHEANDNQDKLSEQTVALIIPEGTTEIKDSEYKNREDIISVVIPDGVVKIGDRAFCGCKNMTSIVIPDSVTHINYQAFEKCESLASLVLPDSLKEIGSYAFRCCKNLTSVIIPKNVHEIKASAFAYCKSLRTVEFMKNGEFIDSEAFLGCENIDDHTKHEIEIRTNKNYYYKTPQDDPEYFDDSNDEQYYFQGCSKPSNYPSQMRVAKNGEWYYIRKKTLLQDRENVKMSYSSKGILSIVDHKGRYMGMQNIAEGFLTKRCIHISTQGPDDNPTAVIITVYDKDDAGKNFDDINFSALKGEYDRYATPSMFSCMLTRATANFDYDKKHNNGTCYRFYRNGGNRDVSPEMFNNPDTDFSKPLAEWE